ncbi:hypothetical protein ACFLXG_01445 [Chloroflexota bacterium]
MKYRKTFRLLVIALLLPLLLVVIPGTVVMAAPVVTISPDSGAAGTRVTVNCANFESYIGDNIYIYFDSAKISTTPVVVPQTGSFSYSFNIPTDAEPGSHIVRVKVELPTLVLRTLIDASFTVIESEIELDRETGPVGTEVTIDGKGFYANSMVTLLYENRTTDVLGTVMVNAAGEFSYNFNVPSNTAGEHKIIAENAYGNSAEAAFEVLPVIALHPTSGATGEMLNIRGTGFGFKSDVAVHFKYDEVAYAKTDEYGNFDVSFNVPDLNLGTYDVQAEDGDGNKDKADFTVTSGASLDKSTGHVGMGLIVSGTGFIAGGTVAIKYDNISVTTVASDSNGAFEATFQVPTSKYGDHTVTVSDGVNTKELTFAMESQAPQVPALSVPAIAGEAKPGVHFGWRSVSDFSPPITYKLQVASDRDFTAIVLEKSGLSKSEYTLTEGEKLAAVKKETPYYWRVSAVDGAYNESGWSAPWSFSVPEPPVPVLLLPEARVEADAEAYFDWEDVAHLIPPITYKLQIASDKDFTAIVLEKSGLNKSEYALTEEEKLAAVKEEAPYYWRVKAIDSEGNESEWAAAGSFYVGFTMPGWITYLLIGFGVIFIGFLAFWLGRRTAYYQS